MFFPMDFSPKTPHISFDHTSTANITFSSEGYGQSPRSIAKNHIPFEHLSSLPFWFFLTDPANFATDYEAQCFKQCYNLCTANAYEDALSWANEALVNHSTECFSKLYGYLLCLKVMCLFMLARDEQVVATCDTILKLNSRDEKMISRALIMWSFMVRARSSLRLGSPQEAIKSTNYALLLYNSDKNADAKWQAELYINYALAYAMDRNISESEYYCSEAERLAITESQGQMINDIQKLYYPNSVANDPDSLSDQLCTSESSISDEEVVVNQSKKADALFFAQIDLPLMTVTALPFSFFRNRSPDFIDTRLAHFFENSKNACLRGRYHTALENANKAIEGLRRNDAVAGLAHGYCLAIRLICHFMLAYHKKALVDCALLARFNDQAKIIPDRMIMWALALRGRCFLRLNNPKAAINCTNAAFNYGREEVWLTELYINYVLADVLENNLLSAKDNYKKAKKLLPEHTMLPVIGSLFPPSEV